MNIHPCVTETDEGIVLALHVQPRASKNEIVGVLGEELKIRLTSPPVEGAANKLCCSFFARLFGLPGRDVELVGGEKSRHKRLLLRGVDLRQVEEMLDDGVL